MTEYVYSYDRETFNDANPEEAIKSLFIRMSATWFEDVKVGDKYKVYRGVKVARLASGFVSNHTVEHILDDMRETAYDDAAPNGQMILVWMLPKKLKQNFSHLSSNGLTNTWT